MGSFFHALADKTTYADYKYVMQDSSAYYIGAKLTYAECMERDDVPFKYKAIIEHYISKDTAPDTSLESQLYYLTPDAFSARTYMELKAKVKIGCDIRRGSLFSQKQKIIYRERVVPISELMEMDINTKQANNVVISELVLSKLALMGFTV